MALIKDWLMLLKQIRFLMGIEILPFKIKKAAHYLMVSVRT